MAKRSNEKESPPVASAERPHLSATQLNVLEQCGEAYRRRYIERESRGSTVPQIRGVAWHRSTAINFRQKISTHQDLTADEIMDAAAESFDELSAEGVEFSRDERRDGPVGTLQRAREQTIAIARLFADRIAPDYQPVFVEQPITIELPQASHDLVGVLDLADEQNVVTDFKTTQRMLKVEDAHHSTQLTIYAAGFHVLTGESPSAVQIEAVQTWGKKPSRRTLKSSRGDRDFRVLAARVNAALSTIAVGAYLPAPVGAWWCSPKWCGYWETCPYVNGSRRRE